MTSHQAPGKHKLPTSFIKANTEHRIEIASIEEAEVAA